MTTQTRIADGATLSAPISFPTRRRNLPPRPDDQEMDLAADLCREAAETPRDAIIQALGNALEVVDLARRAVHPTFRAALDGASADARATYDRVQS